MQARGVIPQPVKFVIPQEGSTLFIDSLVIPKSAKRVDLAHRFINYIMQPKVAALITEETLYPNGNADATALLEPALRERLAIYLDRDTKRRLAALEVFPEKTAQAREETWKQFVSQ